MKYLFMKILSTGSLEITIDREPSRENAQSMMDLVNIAEISVRRVIHMAKTVKSFKALPQADQISLLKGGSIELLILRSVITYDEEKQHFLDPYDKEDTSAMSMDQVCVCICTSFVQTKIKLKVNANNHIATTTS